MSDVDVVTGPVVGSDPAEVQLAGYMLYHRLTPGQGKFYPLLSTRRDGLFYEIFGTLDAADHRVLEELTKAEGHMGREDFVVKCLWWEGDEGNRVQFKANLESQEVTP